MSTIRIFSNVSTSSLECSSTKVRNSRFVLLSVVRQLIFITTRKRIKSNEVLRTNDGDIGLRPRYSNDKTGNASPAKTPQQETRHGWDAEAARFEVDRETK